MSTESKESKNEETKECVFNFDLLDNVSLSQSMKRAMIESKNHIQEDKYVSNVIQFMNKHLDDKDFHSLKLIETNILYLYHVLGEYKVKLKHKGAEELYETSLEAPYSLEQRQLQENMLAKCGLPKLLSNIINKYNDVEWLRQNDNYHRTCIYYSLASLWSICSSQSPIVLKSIVCETDALKTALLILQNDEMTWLEQCVAAQFLSHISVYQDKSIWVELMEKYDLNIMELLIKACCNCFKLQYDYETLEEYHKTILSKYKCDTMDFSKYKSQRDMPTYRYSPFARKNQTTKNIHMIAVKTRQLTFHGLKCLSLQFRNDNKAIDLFFQKLDSAYIKRLLQISTLYMRDGPPTFPPAMNSADILVLLAQHKIIAQTIVNDEEIITNLIISMRSRANVCEYNYREITVILYFIIVEHKLLPKIYYNDVILCFIDIIEEEWKNLSISSITPLTTLSTMIVKILKHVFEIREYSLKDEDEYLCVICQSVYDYPHTLACGHSMCYNCLTQLIEMTQTWWNKYVEKVEQTNQCPVCRKQFFGAFNRIDKLSAFLLDYELLNKMNTSKIVFQCKDDSKFTEFEGTEHEYWKYLKEDNRWFSMKKERKIWLAFNEFCDFMIHKAKVYSAGNVKKEMIDNIMSAKKLKENANQIFKEKKYKLAIKKYRGCLKICPLWHEDRAIYYSNIGICGLKLKDYPKAYKAALKGLSVDPVNVKLTNTGLTALRKMLSFENDQNLLNEYCHGDMIGVCLNSNNRNCLNKRIYDILLHQLLWDCQFWYIQKQSRAQRLLTNDAQEALKRSQEMQKRDKFLIRLREMTFDICNYQEINYDEYQYAEYVAMESKLDLQKNIHDFMVEKLLCLDSKCIDLNEIMVALNENYKDVENVDEYGKFINYDRLCFIVKRSKIMLLDESDDENKCLIKLREDNQEAIEVFYELKDKDKICDDEMYKERLKKFYRVYNPKFLEEEKKLEETMKDNEGKAYDLFVSLEQQYILALFNEWKCHNYNLIHIPLYLWERNKHFCNNGLNDENKNDRDEVDDTNQNDSDEVDDPLGTNFGLLKY